MIRLATATIAIFAFAGPAAAIDFFGNLDGLQEVPPNASPATGRGNITIMGNTMNVDVVFANLTAPLTVAHIHCCAPRGANAGVAVDLDRIPLPVTLSGSFSRMFDLTDISIYNANFLNSSGGTAELARDRLLGAFVTETAYFNLHTSTFPGGEIRGQIAAVPEPATWAMLIAGFGLVGSALRRRPVATAASA